MRKHRILAAQNKLWIGLAKVEQADRTGILGDADRAYTNAIALAHNRMSFRLRVKQALEDLGLKLIRLENAEPLDARLSKFTIDKDLMKGAKYVTRTGRTEFGTFHTFDL
jgi:hypothetical protein